MDKQEPMTGVFPRSAPHRPLVAYLLALSLLGGGAVMALSLPDLLAGVWPYADRRHLGDVGVLLMAVGLPVLVAAFVLDDWRRSPDRWRSTWGRWLGLWSVRLLLASTVLIVVLVMWLAVADLVVATGWTETLTHGQAFGVVARVDLLLIIVGSLLLLPELRWRSWRERRATAEPR